MASEPRAGALPFREAIDYLRRKVDVPTQAWTDLWQGQHAVGFMVAGASSADLVAELHDAVTAAIAGGGTLAEFRRSFDDIVRRHGWSYNGTPGWRSRVIFETNLRMAYQAGKWEQAQRTAGSRPYLRYVAVLDSRTRPLHRKWHGTILPVGDAWWQQHYPPNGWNCRCTVASISDYDLKARGWQVSAKAPETALRQGAVAGRGIVTVPTGVDPGFGYNVGQAAQEAGFARITMAKLGQYPPELAATVAKAFPASVQRAVTEEFASWVQAVRSDIRTQDSLRVVGVLPPDVVAGLQAEGMQLDSAAIVVRKGDLTHLVRDSKAERGQGLDLADVLRLPELLAEPKAVLKDKRDGDLLLVFEPAEGDRLGKLVVRLKQNASGSVGGNRANGAWNVSVTSGLVEARNLRDANFYQALSGVV